MDISNLLGSLSICCWFVVFTPQIYENYKRKSGECLSLWFLWIWLIGDIFNIVGAIMENLLPTMIVLALYFAIADLIIIYQVYYYRFKLQQVELEPLLVENNDEAHRNLLLGRLDTNIIVYTLYCIYVFVFLRLLYEFVDWSQFFGWLSAILYIGSRIPQIIKNMNTGSIEGLSISMFVFSVLGNILYCLAIFCKSVEKEYLLANLPWLVGAGGTTVFDIIIFLQFVLYK